MLDETPVPPSVDGEPAAGPLARLVDRVMATRRRSRDIAAPLTPEDQVVQAMADASPTKWHLAHTTWFWETMLLGPHLPGYRAFDSRFAYLFNSYYETLGDRHPRANRGLLTRPSVVEVMAYREHVDAGLSRLAALSEVEELGGIIEIGIAHEAQHQELMLMDILALFAQSPLHPAYRERRGDGQSRIPEMTYSGFDGGVVEIGHDGAGFAFDNEGPRHKVYLRPFRIADRLVTCGEWLDFMLDGGYRTATLWLADGWSCVQQHKWEAPLYWQRSDGTGWLEMSLAGLTAVDSAAPVSHVSYYEADAFARWMGRRLPTEAEWETAARDQPTAGNLLGSGRLRPAPLEGDGRLQQLFGDVWEWTQSAYSPYPGYRPPVGAVSEYNGKFMANQFVLKGASCVTPDGHSRATYRNFFYPHQRWQFAGVRLAEDQ